MIKSFLKKFSEVAHPPTTRFAWKRQLDPYSLLPPKATIFDIGAKDARGHYLWGTPPADATLTCIDIEDGPGVDIVADAHDLGIIETDSADCLIASGVLLHCREPETVIAEFFRVLKPGGILYIAVPFISPHPAYPTVYQFVSVEGLEYRCRAFQTLESGFNRGPASTMAYLLQYFFAIVFSFNNRYGFAAGLFVFGWLFFWLKYFDVFLARFKFAKLIYSESYIVCKKP
jgi:SAM-dependent methyltransferase